jgi:hypothetical protein
LSKYKTVRPVAARGVWAMGTKAASSHRTPRSLLIGESILKEQSRHAGTETGYSASATPQSMRADGHPDCDPVVPKPRARSNPNFRQFCVLWKVF